MKGETQKAHERRLKEGWYERYCPASARGIDIGAGSDPIHSDHSSWLRWDKKEGDAQDMAGVRDATYQVVYASHVLEHMHNPIVALRSWYRILKPLGQLIVCVPHRDLYEKKKERPSLWNPEHRSFWLPDQADAPDTFSLLGSLRWACPEAVLLSLRVLDYGWVSRSPTEHSIGEYSIELICRKP